MAANNHGRSRRGARAGAAALTLMLAVTAARGALSVLAEPPDWRVLDDYQGTLTEGEFRARVPLFSNDGALYQWLTVGARGVEVFADRGKTRKLWELRFANDNAANNAAANVAQAILPVFPQYTGKIACATLGSLKQSKPLKPLAGLKICLDPGHIGGAWAEMEERHFRIRNGPWVDEATLNLITCEWLERGLREAGAEVCWTKRTTLPVTARRPAEFTPQAIKMLWRSDAKKAARARPAELLKLVRWYEELIFYRVAEIQARAAVVEHLRPDLTLCLHYNALGWGRRGPRLYQNVNRIVIFTHGSYLARELEFDDLKFSLFKKLLENSRGAERRVADAIARQAARMWNYPPEQYGASALTATCRPAGKTPYVWSRNLLANRLYPGPVVFVEGPFMDDALTYRRLIAGDYDGWREIAGRQYRSIFREYAEVVARGVIEACGGE
ncbi:MAG: hypothetical protein LBK60_12100 [Verrucomicrobiales bacterium]|nr:hypothetical protein [Verrucomicrobiales bacterium]